MNIISRSSEQWTSLSILKRGNEADILVHQKRMSSSSCRTAEQQPRGNKNSGPFSHLMWLCVGIVFNTAVRWKELTRLPQVYGSTYNDPFACFSLSASDWLVLVGDWNGKHIGNSQSSSSKTRCYCVCVSSFTACVLLGSILLIAFIESKSLLLIQKCTV